MILRERDTPQGVLVSVCDRGLIGETFENGDVSLTVTEEFYGGDVVDAADVVQSLGRAQVANIVGERAVDLAIEHGFVEEDHVLDVGETRHAQMMRMGQSTPGK